MAEGELKGRTEGRVEGKAEGIQSVARAMLQKGMSVKEISEVTGLSEKEIVELKRPSII